MKNLYKQHFPYIQPYEKNCSSYFVIHNYFLSLFQTSVCPAGWRGRPAGRVRWLLSGQPQPSGWGRTFSERFSSTCQLRNLELIKKITQRSVHVECIVYPSIHHGVGRKSCLSLMSGNAKAGKWDEQEEISPTSLHIHTKLMFNRHGQGEAGDKNVM